MGAAKHGRCRRGVRPALGSIGRPGAGTTEIRQRFWRAVAEGLSSDKAAEAAGVSSAVGARLFRQGGGMPDVCLDQPVHLVDQYRQRWMTGCLVFDSSAREGLQNPVHAPCGRMNQG